MNEPNLDLTVERDLAAEAVDMIQPESLEEETVSVPKSVLSSLVDAYSEKKIVEDASFAKQIIEAHGLDIKTWALWDNSELVALGKWLSENHQLS